ncbi:uncharacterized protein LOC133317280 [Gastrolobium bilobum]|uniref:uncharacterized protein LOC133317280 n=1 Tax=Gastrolobium bilobum TaxID=150636 RepID=UPI002AB0E79B|nr:uncharacterized protein LOC133317280 [Gastrolobium bilobum]
MLSDSANYHSAEMSFRITQDDGRFFSKLMAKETSKANSSSRRVFYYRETSVAVPFMWEAQPGTPKHPLLETSLPPLTPPPSYYSNSKSNVKRKNSKANIFFTSILPRFAGSSRNKALVSPSSSWSLSSSSSSSSSWSLAYSSPSFSIRDKDQVQGNLSFSRSRSPSSTMGSPLRHKCSHGFKGCYPFGKMKNVTVSHD